MKQVYTQFYHQLVDAVSDPHTCQSLTAQLHPTPLIPQEKIAQLSSRQDTGGQYLRVLGLEDEPLLLAVLLEKMEEVKPLQELAKQMSTSLTESKQGTVVLHFSLCVCVCVCLFVYVHAFGSVACLHVLWLAVVLSICRVAQKQDAQLL